MTIKLYLFYSFLVHTVILTYLFTLPVYKGGIHLKSFVDYVVYLRNEEGKTVVKPPVAYKVKKSEARLQRVAGDSNTAVKTREVEAKENTKQLEAENVAASEIESRLKMEETVEEKITQTVEVKEPLEPQGVEKTLKEEAAAVNAKEEVYEAEELEMKEATAHALYLYLRGLKRV